MPHTVRLIVHRQVLLEEEWSHRFYSLWRVVTLVIIIRYFNNCAVLAILLVLLWLRWSIDAMPKVVLVVLISGS